MQVDVCSAVPQMTLAMRNLTSVCRADEASSREYTPQKPDRPHTHASVALWTTISEACSLTLSVLAEGGTGMAVCNTSETVRVYYAIVLLPNPRSSLTSSVYIHTHAEGDQRTITIAIIATFTASQKLTLSVTSVTS
jgi:hypothetical protein